MSTVATAPEDGSAEPSAAQLPMAGPSAAPAPARAAHVDAVAATRGGGQPKAGPAAESPVPDATALPQVLKIVGAVVSPATLLLALMYYVGRLEFAGFFSYFGADVTVLNPTVQDYLSNSVDGMIPPLIATAGAGLLALWVHQLLFRGLPEGTRRIVVRALAPAAAIAGFVLVSLAIADLVLGTVFPAAFLEGRGLSLSIGVLLLAYAARLVRLLIAQRRPTQVPQRPPGAVAVAEWGAVFILVSVGLFWAAGSYAIGVGMTRAQELESLLPSRPDVVVYSEKRLSLQAPGVREVTCQYPDAAYRFRYDSLKLVPMPSGDQYLLLPAGWTHTNGAVIVLRRSDSLRLEFSPPGHTRNATC
ncbi:MAG: hypothetical protein JO115_21050 [Pseudonocardiales bacterium]|nr:hypothetical protein [Pseudonocardiales bacterium]